MKKKTLLIMALIICFLCGCFCFNKSKPINAKLDEKDEVKAILISDITDTDVKLDIIGVNAFCDNSDFLADYYLIELTDITKNTTETLQKLVQCGKKLIIVSDNEQDIKVAINSIFDINTYFEIKGCELLGVCIYKEETIIVVPIANAIFSEGKESNTETSFITNNIDRINWIYAYSVYDLERLLKLNDDYNKYVKSLPSNSFSRYFPGSCSCSTANGTNLGTLYITEYIYDIGTSYNTSTGKTEAIFDAISQFRIFPTSNYNAKSFRARMSANQINETIIDSTVLSSDTNPISLTISGGDSVSVGTTYTTNTSGLIITNMNPSYKEYDWNVTCTSDAYGNGRSIEPGIRVCNEDISYVSGVGSYFYDVMFNRYLIAYSYSGELVFAGGQW